VLYEYDRQDLDGTSTAVTKTGAYTRTRIEYQSLAPSNHPEADTVVAHFFQPHRRRSSRPVVFLHGMGKYSFGPLLPCPRGLAERGVPSLFMVLPLHYDRAPAGEEGGRLFMLDDLENSLLNFRQAVVDVRTGLDFMEEEGLAKHGFTLLAISFGGMVGTIAMGVDRRIENAVLCVTGGNLMHIIWHSIFTRTLRGQNRETLAGVGDRAGCRRGQRRYRKYLDSLDSPEDLDRVAPPLECFRFDPLTFARFISSRKVVMYNAIFDPIMPHGATRDLWEELGRPERHFLLCEHNTIVLYRRTIVRRTAELAGAAGGGAP
jgi:pimeloyl-ACP methyl ester carboxylesterase